MESVRGRAWNGGIGGDQKLQANQRFWVLFPKGYPTQTRTLTPMAMLLPKVKMRRAQIKDVTQPNILPDPDEGSYPKTTSSQTRKENRKMTTEQMTTEQIIQQCKTLKELSTERAQYIRARTRLTNQMKAISRKHLCKGFQEKVSDKELNELIKTCMEDGTTGAGLVPLDISRINLTGNLQQIEREMRTIVRELPIWTRWASAIAGVGELTIGNIVGGSVCSAEVDLNTGEKYAKRFVTIGDYTNPAKLWKRWGVGVVDGQRQKRIKATDADKKKFREGGKFVGEQAKAIRHGYSPLRRAMLWNIGDSFVKQGKYYRRRYDQEKEKQLELYPEVMMDRNGTPKKKNYAKARAHNRAMRKATKLFLTDLWNKWREFHGEGPYHKLSTDRWEVPYP